MLITLDTLEFQGIADELQWVAPDPIEVKSDTDFRAELAEHTYQALIRLDRRKAIGDKLGAFSRLLQGFKAGVSDQGGLEFGFDAQAVANARRGSCTAPTTA